MRLPDHLADYVPVKQRIVNMRNEHAEWSVRPVVTILDGYYLAVCDIHDQDGRHIATGSALEKGGKPFDYEKAETSAIGRALVFAGYVDSIELSEEEHERSMTVPRETTPPEYQIDGIDEPPPDPADDPKDDGVSDLAVLLDRHFPIQSAPKAAWRDYIAELVAVCAAEGVDMDWKILTKGKGFNDLTIDDLKQLALRSKEILQ